MPSKDELEQKVCARCGGRLTRKEITENDCFTGHEPKKINHIVCEHCSVIAHAVTPEQFELARKLVIEGEYYPYSHMLEQYTYSKRDDPYFIESQTAGAYGLIRIVEAYAANREAKAAREAEENLAKRLKEQAEYIEYGVNFAGDFVSVGAIEAALNNQEKE